MANTVNEFGQESEQAADALPKFVSPDPTRAPAPLGSAPNGDLDAVADVRVSRRFPQLSTQADNYRAT